jgi:hypothetical protein
LIVFKIVPKAKSEQEREEFFKSLASHHSGEVPYQTFSHEEETLDGDIFITLADDCIILGHSWDKYIKHSLESGLPQYGMGKDYVPTWEGFVQRRMALESRRPPAGFFPYLKVTLATR